MSFVPFHWVSSPHCSVSFRDVNRSDWPTRFVLYFLPANELIQNVDQQTNKKGCAVVSWPNSVKGEGTSSTSIPPSWVRGRAWGHWWVYLHPVFDRQSPMIAPSQRLGRQAPGLTHSNQFSRFCAPRSPSGCGLEERLLVLLFANPDLLLCTGHFFLHLEQVLVGFFSPLLKTNEDHFIWQFLCKPSESLVTNT